MDIIDRRLNPKSKSLGNRQRFLKRAKADIKEAIKDAVNNRNVTDGSNGGIRVRTKSVAEPTLSPDYNTGSRDFVLPGNREYVVGDDILRPRKEGSAGAGGGAGTESSEDDFEFILDNSEFLDYFFEDLALPDMVKKSLKKTKRYSYVRAGFTPEGPPARLNPVRTMRKSLGRRLCLGRPSYEEIEALEKELEIAKAEEDKIKIAEIEEKLNVLFAKRSSVPFIDPIDLQYSRLEKVEKPATQAVMFCLMDVSASMTEHMKNLAKRFFILLHIFLKRHYKDVEIVFIRHTTEAKVVDEDTFFKSRESGGTKVSSVLEEMLKVIKDKYDPSDWNIYAAQVSDGDNLPDDSPVCLNLMNALILSEVQYFAYLEVADPVINTIPYTVYTDLWKCYDAIKSENFDRQKVCDAGEIYPVFHKLFSKERS
jgi:uncharacterized sporulation protein YeaH/YhbH (DUF444 family)